MSDNPTPLAGLLLDQRQRWHRGERILVETYLDQQPGLQTDTECLLDLIYNEFILREKHGEAPQWEEYLQRFPHLSEALRLQFEMDQALQDGDLLPANKMRSTLHLARGGDTEIIPSTLPVLPGYQVLELIGRGGMGVVYRARQLGLNRQVALKMIRSGDDTDPEQLARLRAEAEAVARLQHPNIVQIHEIGEWRAGGSSAPVPYLSLEYVGGGSLDRMLAGTPQPPRQAAALVETLARAMHTAHQQGIIHRDLKPANVLLSFSRDTPAERSASASQLNEAVPKITDFGLAKRLDVSLGHTQTGAIMGTPSYMAPEQAQGRNQDVGPATDVYALGAMLYELLTGRPPFRGEGPLDTLQQVMTREPVAPRQLQPKVPGDLETICLKCLQKEPRRRYASAQELADDLRRFQSNEPIQARPVGRAERLWRWGKRKPAVAGLLAAIIVLVTATLISETWLLARAERSRQLAETKQAEAQENLVDATINLRLARESADNYVTHVGDNLRLRQEDLRPLRKELLETVVPLYEKLIERHSDKPEVQLERGRAYRRLAYLTWEIGERSRAISLQEQAAAIFDELSRTNAGEPEYRQELARSRNRLGQFYEQTGRIPDAEDQFKKGLEIRAQLVSDYPKEPRHHHGLSQSQGDLGMFYLSTSRHALAEPAILESLKTLTAVEPLLPDVADVPRDLAGNHNNLGRLFLETQRAELAEEQFLIALKVQQALVDKYPRISDYQYDLASSHMNLALVYDNLKKASLAEQQHHEAVRLFKELTREHASVTDYQQRLGQAHSNLGALYERTKRGPQAETEYQEAVRIYQGLVDRDRGVVAFQQTLAKLRHDLGGYYGRTGRPALAEAELLKECQVLEELRSQYPANFLNQDRLSQARALLAFTYFDSGRPTEAEAQIKKAVAVGEELVRQAPDNLDYSLNLGVTYFNWGRRERRAGKLPAAVEWFDRALKETAKALPQDKAREVTCFAYWERALAVGQMGRHTEAIKDWDAALAHDNGDNRTAFLLSRAASLARLGDYAQAVQQAEAVAAGKTLPFSLLFAQARVYSLAARAAEQDPNLAEAERRQRAGQYGEQGIKVLRRAVEAGYKDVQRLKTDPELEPLRAREEFKELLLKLEKPPE